MVLLGLLELKDVSWVGFNGAEMFCRVCRGNISTSFAAAKFPPGEIQPSDATHFEVRCQLFVRVLTFAADL